MIFKSWCGLHLGGPYATIVATAMLNLIIIIILGEIWCRLAEWLTDKENHKYTDTYEGTTVVFICKQFLNSLLEMVFPWIKRTWNRKKILAEALKRLELLKARSKAGCHNGSRTTSSPVTMFGFCTLFVTSFPVAPAFALINNWIDLRMEAFRLLTQYRRPFAYRAQDIGMWENIIEFVSFTSNLFIKYLHATKDEELLAAQLEFILVFEHVVFLFKIILRAAIPNVPLTIKLAVQRSKYMSRVANEDLDSEMDSEYYGYEDTDSLSQSDDTSESEGEDDGSVSRAGSTTRHPSEQTNLGTGTTTAAVGEDGGDGDQGFKKTDRPGFGLPRLWKIPPSIRSASVAGTNEKVFSGAATANGYGVGYLSQQQQQEEREQEEMMQHRSPLSQSPIVGSDRLLHPRQSLGSQR
ncbi:Anoctamin-7 [Mortierella sp. GBA35]|nr:Anoctamin-7 [Mortierella sp. GBA35]